MADEEETLEDKINKIDVVIKHDLKLVVDKDFTHFDPKITESFDDIRDFIGCSESH